MHPSTDYIEQLARLARKIQADAAMGSSPPQLNAEFFKVLAKAMDEITAGFKAVSQRE